MDLFYIWEVYDKLGLPYYPEELFNHYFFAWYFFYLLEKFVETKSL
jgi:hypothetical protein